MFTTGQKFIGNNAHSMEIIRKLYGDGNESPVPLKKARTDSRTTRIISRSYDYVLSTSI